MDNVLNLVYTKEQYENFYNDFSYDEIMNILKDDTEDDFKKIFSIINLSCFLSEDDFICFINHLTNHSTPIREITAYKLEEFIDKYSDYFCLDFSKNKLLDGIIDINPNISRAVCNVVNKLPELNSFFEEEIIKRIGDLLKEIDIYQQNTGDLFVDNKKNRKNHAKNKKLFALYWYLEALNLSLTNENDEKITEILKKTIKFCDYTIREKTAKILANIDNAPLELLQSAKSDQNFYVKNQVYDKINFED